PAMRGVRCCVVLLLLSAAGSVLAEEPALATQASVDAVWIICAGALVFFMQAGFALLESGLCRAKNSVNVIMKNYTDLCVGTLAFWAVGFALMFGSNATGWIGTDHFLLSQAELPVYAFLFFQMM